MSAETGPVYNDGARRVSNRALEMEGREVKRHLSFRYRNRKKNDDDDEHGALYHILDFLLDLFAYEYVVREIRHFVGSFETVEDTESLAHIEVYQNSELHHANHKAPFYIVSPLHPVRQIWDVIITL